MASDKIIGMMVDKDSPFTIEQLRNMTDAVCWQWDGNRLFGVSVVEAVNRSRTRREMYEQEQSFTREKDRIYRELRAWPVDPDRTNAGLTKIYMKQSEYDKAVLEAGLAGRVPLIKSSELSRQIKGVKVPPKKEFIRQRLYEQ